MAEQLPSPEAVETRRGANWYGTRQHVVNEWQPRAGGRGNEGWALCSTEAMSTRIYDQAACDAFPKQYGSTVRTVVADLPLCKRCERKESPMTVPTSPVQPTRGAEAVETLDGVPIASAALIDQLRRTVADRMAHDHASAAGPGDLYCLNLTSYMGERMGPVLQRLDSVSRIVNRTEAKLRRVDRLLDSLDGADHGDHDPQEDDLACVACIAEELSRALGEEATR